MKVNDQIRARREQLGISVRELAEAVQVSEQAVRHWESGRSSPGKLKARDVERELSFTIDWTEGATDRGRPVGASALISQGDLELMLVMVQNPGKLALLALESFAAIRGLQLWLSRILQKSSCRLRNRSYTRARDARCTALAEASLLSSELQLCASSSRPPDFPGCLHVCGPAPGQRAT